MADVFDKGLSGVELELLAEIPLRVVEFTRGLGSRQRLSYIIVDIFEDYLQDVHLAQLYYSLQYGGFPLQFCGIKKAPRGGVFRSVLFHNRSF